ncbi:MAG: hypothetical protein BroJett039_05780 [Chloroflexota bacterium]|nr:MAG: hypothetical protein BroJett039_05780 [Chloroflexota bacterium]
MKFRWNLQSILGLTLVVVAAASLALDAVGIIQIWMLREPVTQDAINTLDLLNSTLDTTAQGLSIVKTSLKSVTDSLGALESTVASAATTIDQASTTVGSLGNIVGKNLSGTIDSALGALNAVEDTARTVDDFLAGVSKLPFVNINYNPEQSLSASVNAVTEQLAQVPISLSNLETNLGESGNSLDKVGGDARALSSSLGQVQDELQKLVDVIAQYQTQVAAFQGTVQNLRANIVTIVWGIVLFLTFILLWLAVTMLITLLKGLAWMGFNFHLFQTQDQSQAK